MQSNISTTPTQAPDVSPTSLEYTQKVVKRTLRDAFNVGRNHNDRLALDAYARAVGADVAASDRFNIGEFLTEQEAQKEGDLMAGNTLASGVCTTDNPKRFKQRYSAKFFDGYLGYCTLARTTDGVNF